MPLSFKQKTVDPSRFSMVPRADVPRSSFDIQHTHKTTFDSGKLVPVYLDEVLPGDSVRLKMTAFCRLATPLVPLMDNLYLESFFFYVPNRLLWSNWERFMGERATPTDTTAFLVPQINVASTQLATVGVPHTLADYFGLVLNNFVDTIQVSALPFRAYALIWNDWFRDQDINVPLTVPVGDGPDDMTVSYGSTDIILCMPRMKRHDYFTSARPWPEKPINYLGALSGEMGGPLIPGGRMLFPQGGAPVSGFGVQTGTATSPGPISIETSGSRVEVLDPVFADDTAQFIIKATETNGFPDVRVLINDIRTANMVQMMMERNARGGTRYAEIVRSHFGVTSPDARLQRPEYLGGGRTSITVNPVAQTSATGATGTVLGELAGIGTGIAMNHGFSSSFTEHGLIVGLVNVRADMTYQQGINRMWFRKTLFDFYWPGLANLGEQAILRQEIYATGDPTNDEVVFGYQERWSEYKYKPNRVSGVFRSTLATAIDFWHLGQLFTAAPVLNSGFLAELPPVDRALQVDTTGTAQFLLDTLFDCRMVRAMPMFSIPGMGPRG